MIALSVIPLSWYALQRLLRAIDRVRFARFLLALTRVQASMARSRFEKSRQSWTGVPMRMRAGCSARGCGMGTMKARTARGGKNGNATRRIRVDSRNRLPLCPIESANATDGQDLAGSELARRLQLHGVGQHP